MKITIGADPEVFLKHKETMQFHAALHIPGTKDAPHPLKKGSVQRDGVALEFGIDPASSAEEFSDNIETVFEQCKKIAGDEYDLVATPSVKFDEKYFGTLPPEILVLGCEKDWNAYTGGTNPPPKPNETWRTGAGHLHIGWTKVSNPMNEDHMYDCTELVKRLDSYFQPFFPLYDTDTIRSNMYGMAGSFRPKPYGLEYRVPSNAWLNDKALWPWLFHSVQWVFENGISGKKFRRADRHDYLYSTVYHHVPEVPNPVDRYMNNLPGYMIQTFQQDDYPKYPLPVARTNPMFRGY